MRKCYSCRIEKELCDFYRKKDGYRYECKECTKKMVKKYEEENPEKIKLKNKNRRENNKEKLKELNKKWLQENKEKRREYKRNYRELKMLDPIFRMKESIRGSIRKHLMNKSKRTHEILGCSYEYFKLYVESKFESWMTWDNYGLYNGNFNFGWDIDHIIPSSSAKSEEEIIKLNHYTNLQPLCSKINRDIKKDK